MKVATIDTTKGTIELELFEKEAPKTVANFTKLAGDHFYDGLTFHRVIKDFMVQTGCPFSKTDPNRAGTGGPGYTIPCETKGNPHKHGAGALSMAHRGPNTGGSQFFITHRATPHLDGVHTVFGKVLKGQDPLHILGDGTQIRHYTYGGDLARGIRLAIESDGARNEDFNLSTATSTTVRELAEAVWRKIRDDAPLELVSDEPFPYDVQRRVPDVRKAREVLGFEATTTLDQALDEIVPWIGRQIELGGI